jgi:hypothetical protein
MEQVGRITFLVMITIHKSTGIYPLPFTEMPQFILPLQHEPSLLYGSHNLNAIFYIYFEICFRETISYKR